MNEDLLDPGTRQGGNMKNLPNATATLVLGIISIVGCFLYGIPGIVCGIIAIVLYKKDKTLYDSNPAMYEMSYKNSKAGYVCGIIGLILSILFFLALIVYFIVVVSVVSQLR